MTDREKVVHGLQMCIKARCGEADCFDCSYCDDKEGGCQTHLFQDAIALLKAQRPRLMSLQEVLVSSGAIWLEFEAEEGGYHRYGYAFVSCANEHMVEFIVRDGYRPLIQFPRADYLKYWRCWTTQPTQEQREGEKWHGRSR